jgi:cytochrome c-type biogenesis protein CcmF
MENLGYLGVLLAFLLSVYATVAALTGKLRRNPFLELSAQRAVLAAWLMTTSASAILLHAILTDNFSFNYVASRSNADLDLLYKVAAWWGGQEGSLLFWSWIAATYSFVAVYTGRTRHRNMISYVVATMAATQAFFLGLVAFKANPFQVIMSGPQITSVPDGSGLNPLLQHPMMAIHPPMLYLGFVGFTVPFAFALASLITRQPGERWIHTTRVWTMITWLFQSIGILLGANWAYVVLGWGGYWGWDPVENASLLPWLTGTAFLHSVMMQEKKGMMKVWNIILISATFFLCIFGTMMTRGGLVSSVHAFAQSEIGVYFVWFLVAGIGFTAYMIVSRLDYLRSEAELDSVVSRESSFLFNNVILLASCFAVLWGTLFPVISEYFTGDKITVGAPFFNKVNVPIALFLLFLTGVGPLFAWRRTSPESLRRNFRWPALGALVCAIALFAAGMRHFYALVCLSLCAFVTLCVLMEFYRGGRVIQRKQRSSLAAAVLELTRRNTRRYGGYLVHMAIVLMFVGFSGAAFNVVHQEEMAVGDSIAVGRYDFKLQNVSEMDNPNYFRAVAALDVSKDGDFLETLMPERRFYHASNQPTSRVDVRHRLREDVYVVYAGQSNDGANPVLQVYINPLVNWIWIGALVLVLGTSVALVPSKSARRRVARTGAPRLKEEPVAASGD